jgi:hypothetical protein
MHVAASPERGIKDISFASSPVETLIKLDQLRTTSQLHVVKLKRRGSHCLQSFQTAIRMRRPRAARRKERRRYVHAQPDTIQSNMMDDNAFLSVRWLGAVPSGFIFDNYYSVPSARCAPLPPQTKQSKKHGAHDLILSDSAIFRYEVSKGVRRQSLPELATPARSKKASNNQVFILTDARGTIRPLNQTTFIQTEPGVPTPPAVDC